MIPPPQMTTCASAGKGTGAGSAVLEVLRREQVILLHFG